MKMLRLIVPALAVATTLSGAALADSPVSASAAAPTGRSHVARHGMHGHRQGAFAVLRQLDLSADQQAQVKSIFAQARPQLSARRESARGARLQLLSTPPTDPGYPALVQAAQSEAAAGVQLRANVWAQLYAVLTPAQQQSIGPLVAQQEQARQARAAQWRARHSG